MLINEEGTREQYDSTKEQPLLKDDTLPFPHRFAEKNQVKAVLLDGTQLIYGQDYVVEYSDEVEKKIQDGETLDLTDYANVKLLVDIPVGDTITLYRETTLDQINEFPQEGRFDSRKIEDSLDKLTMQNQEQQESLGRALKLPLTANKDLKDLALPNPDPNKSVKWNSTGTALVNTSFDPDTALVTTENFKNQSQQSAKDSAASAAASEASAQRAKNYVDTIAPMGDKITKDADAIINRVGLNMFDPVIKDHVLTYPDGQGLALQGTWVYRDAKAGERYGYPDFYNTCVKEFKESGASENNISVTGTITNNKGVISGFSDTNYTLLPAMFNPTDKQWEIVLSFTRTGENTTWESLLGAGVSDWTYGIHIYNRDNKVCMQASSNGTSWNMFSQTGTTILKTNTKYWVKLVYNKSSYRMWLSTTGKFNGEETLEAQVASSTDILVTTIQSLGFSKVATGHQFLGSIDLNECYININGSRWWDGVRLRRHSNGHYYYPISAKATIDSRFNTNGAAWYYGVDEVNKRIFLPRNNWFMQMASNSVGSFTDAGLPNITGEYSNTARAELYPAENMTFKGALVRGASNKNTVTTASNYTGYGFKFDASKSNATYGKSPTVQPKSVKQLLYICVGNQVAKDSWVDTITQVKNGAKEIDDSVQGAIADVEQAKDECIEEIGTKTAELTSKMAFSMFDTLIKDYKITYPNDQGFALQGTYVYHDADPGIRYGYPDFYNKCLEEFNQATSTSTVNNVTVKTHSNGHKYYNISDKAAIDSYYTSTGSAWFYGIDTANKRVFLPRDKYFAIKNSASTVQVRGNGKTLGFTDGTNTGGLYTSQGGAYITTPCYNMNVGETRGTGQLAEKIVVGVTTDASKSGLVANTGSILQTHGEKYLYICVGNRLQDTSWIDVATQVENGIKDIDEVYQRDLANINSAYNSAMNTLQAVGPVLQTGSTMTGPLSIHTTQNTVLGLRSTRTGTDTYNEIQFQDHTGTRRNTIRSNYTYDDSGAIQKSIFTIGSNKLDGSAPGGLVLTCDTTGTLYFDFPKCTTKATTASTANGNKVAVVVKNYVNGTSWYRVWSDGWIEQGAWLQGSWTKASKFTLVKSFSNANYTLVANVGSADVGADCVVLVDNKTASSFYIESSRGTAANYTFKQIYYYAAGY